VHAGFVFGKLIHKVLLCLLLPQAALVTSMLHYWANIACIKVKQKTRLARAASCCTTQVLNACFHAMGF
jgi:hypothetical protein